jgi:hypothetical protein
MSPTETTHSVARKLIQTPTHRRHGSGIPPLGAITLGLRRRVYAGHHRYLVLSSLPCVLSVVCSCLLVRKYTVALGHACVLVCTLAIPLYVGAFLPRQIVKMRQCSNWVVS